MKKTLLAVAMACIATASFGWISVSWDAFCLNGYQEDGTVATADADTASILWEMVYTTQSSVAKPTMDSTGAITYQSGDQIVASRTWSSESAGTMLLKNLVSEDGASYLSKDDVTATSLDFDAELGYITTEGGAAFKHQYYNASAGSVYAAVFQYLSNGDVYWASTSLVTPESWDGSKVEPFPTNVDDDWSENGVSGWAKLGSITPPTEVPEPATMSLLGLGALAMVIRRKLRK